MAGDELWDEKTVIGIKLRSSEQKAARYLGFNDIGRFRAYLSSHIFLQYWMYWSKANASTKSFRAPNVFRYLKSSYDNNSLSEDYTSTLDALTEKYPMQSAIDGEDEDFAALINPRLAGIVYQLVHNHETFDEARQRQVKATFDEMSDSSGVDTGINERRVLPTLTEAPQTPIWGPLPGEAWGEPYNRAINALQVFTNGIARWKERYGKEDGLRPCAVPDQFIPKFMLVKNMNEVIGEGISNLRTPVTMLAPKTFRLYWADPQSTKDELGEQHSTIPEFTQTGPDPRSFAAPEWRDKIRALYEFERLGVNFLSISFTYTEYDDDEQMDFLNCDWGLAQEVFTRLDQSQISKIRFKTRPLDLHEVIYEWSSVPSRVASYIYVNESGRIEAVENSTSMKNSQNPTSLNPEIFKALNRFPDHLPDQSSAGRSFSSPPDARPADFTTRRSPADQSGADRPFSLPPCSYTDSTTLRGRRDQFSEELPISSSSDTPPPDPTTLDPKVKRIADEKRHQDFIDVGLRLTAERLKRQKDPTSGPGVPDPNRAYNDRGIEGMLAEHDGVDIRQPKKRRDWTESMLVKHGASS